jgi:hypothetical protein
MNMKQHDFKQQREGLEAVRRELLAQGQQVGVIGQKVGEPNIMHLPVSRKREVVYAIDDGYDLWGPKHPVAFDLTLSEVVDRLT